MNKINWTTEQRKLSELIPWPRNPRQIKRDQVERLQESLDEFGQVETIAVGPDNEIYNGHQRLKSWAAKYGDITVDVRVSNRPLTEKEREKLVIFLHKGASGEWDFDILANEFEIPDLLNWGFSEFELGLGEVELDYAPPESDSKGWATVAFTFERDLRDEIVERLKALECEEHEFAPGLASALYYLVFNDGLDSR